MVVRRWWFVDCVSGPRALDCSLMRLNLTRSGGLTGVPRTVTVDDGRLAPADRAELRELLDRARLFELPARLPAPQRQPDRFQYELHAEDGARRQTVVVDEAAVPATLQPLLDWLFHHG